MRMRAVKKARPEPGEEGERCMRSGEWSGRC